MEGRLSVATFHATRKLMTLCGDGTTGAQGPQQVISADRDENVDEMILGDLLGSRVVLAHDAMPERSDVRLSIYGPVGAR